MNSKTVELLKNIDSYLDENIYVGITESQTLLTSIDNHLDSIETDIGNIEYQLTSNDSSSVKKEIQTIETNTGKTFTELNEFIQPDITSIKETVADIGTTTAIMNNNIASIESDVADIGTTLATWNERNKTFIYDRLMWDDIGGTDQYLPPDVYSSTAAVGNYQNNSGKTLYVSKYVFSYIYNSDDITPSNQFHSGYNSGTLLGEHDGSAWTSNYIDIHRNREMYEKYSRLALDGSSTYLHLWNFEFDPPISIQNGNYFAHKVQCNTSNYSTYSTTGMLTGYTIS